ncbi:hypothetical protein [Vibrio hepatarius]|uniref:hypothetical protein n=1 Tax=Vibrio hepatarius TaxID=171383 RepID=UPI001C080D41|nr:hypothetical protein [Vibrio hepatarius]MBU2895228.1 hypothetical protein [Vibrio hepatarius]
MKNAKEILEVCRELGIKCELLPNDDAKIFIDGVTKKFEPSKTAGHLSIENDSVSLPIEDYEYEYSSSLPEGKGFIFFDQSGKDKNCVVEIEDVRVIGAIMENAFGMEYFVSDSNNDYLVCVSWYAVEFKGLISINSIKN